MSRARLSFSATTKSSPASGVPLSPSTSTGVDGPASCRFCPRSSTQRTHAAPFAAGDENVADPQRAALDQHGRDGAAAALELGLEHDALGRAVRVGLEVEQLGLQQDRFLELVEIGLL